MRNLDRISSNITWDPPFSLNLTNAEPDIVYCIEVYDITCQPKVFLFRDCNVTESYYVSDTLLEGYLYNITVTPRSNVNGALTGTSLVKEGKLFVPHSWCMVLTI